MAALVRILHLPLPSFSSFFSLDHEHQDHFTHSHPCMLPVILSCPRHHIPAEVIHVHLCAPFTFFFCSFNKDANIIHATIHNESLNQAILFSWGRALTKRGTLRPLRACGVLLNTGSSHRTRSVGSPSRSRHSPTARTGTTVRWRCRR